MSKSTISRKGFIRNSALGLMGMSMIPGMANAKTVEDEKSINFEKSGSSSNYVLKNVRLETGFEYDGDEVVATKTDLFRVEINNGKIENILPNDPAAHAFDAKGLLMFPSFKDMHIHLDKTRYGEGWQAIRQRKGGGIKGMIALEQRILPELLKHSTAKAEKMIGLLQSKGSTFARSQVNIEPTSKLKSLEHLQVAMENKKQSFGVETVAFPQHGLFYTNSVPYMKEAAKLVDYIGGLDPISIDGSLEKPMDFMVQLALDHGKGIDMHSHETGSEGEKAVNYLIDKVNENPELKGKTSISHCFILGALEERKSEAMIERLADAQITVNSTVPFGGLIMPIPSMLKHGMKVYAGNDTIIDHWSTFGTGSVLGKAKLAAQLYGYYTEFDLSRILKIATAGVLPLDDKGDQQWPKAGDDADLVFLDASCSAEAVSRVSPVKSLIYRGNVVF